MIRSQLKNFTIPVNYVLKKFLLILSSLLIIVIPIFASSKRFVVVVVVNNISLKTAETFEQQESTILELSVFLLQTLKPKLKQKTTNFTKFTNFKVNFNHNANKENSGFVDALVGIRRKSPFYPLNCEHTCTTFSTNHGTACSPIFTLFRLSASSRTPWSGDGRVMPGNKSDTMPSNKGKSCDKNCKKKACNQRQEERSFHYNHSQLGRT